MLLDGTESQKILVRDVIVTLIQSKKDISVETGTEPVLPPIMNPVELMVWIHASEDIIGLKVAVECKNSKLVTL